MSKLDTAKKVAKTAGKVALSIAVPPVGFMTLIKDKYFAAAVGVTVSGVMSTGIGFTRKNLTNEIFYDSPEVNVTYLPNSVPAAIAERLISPLAFYLDSTPKTDVLSNEGKVCRAKGDNIIYFDKEVGKYFSNLDETTLVGLSDNFMPVIDLESLAELKAEREAKVNELEKKIIHLNAAGRILESRATQEGLARTKIDYDSKISTLQTTYNEVRSAFTTAVDAMNYELQYGHKIEEQK